MLNSGITPIDIHEASASGPNVWAELQKHVGTTAPRLDDMILFCRQMYTLSRSGVPLIRGITGLAETARNPMLAGILRSVRAELESGRELSAALAQSPNVFNQLMVSMVRVGENTGRLDEAFLQLSQYLELERDTRNRVKTALRYPTIVVIAMVAAIGVINMFVIPAFAKVFAGMKVDLLWQTKLLMATSKFFVNYWPFLLALTVVALLGLRYYVKTDEGRYAWDRVKLRIPIIGSIILRATLGRFARSFAMTSRSGVPLIQALTVVSRALDNAYLGERVLQMRNGVERGDTLTRTAAAAGLFTPLVLQMMSVGEETGAIDAMMEEVADFYEREVDYDLKNMASLIEPILIVGVGILVLILALGVFLPMWELTQLARR